MTKNKILNIIQRYHPARGGAELFMKVLSEYLHKDLQYDVTVWTTDAYSPDTLWDLGTDVIEPKQENISGVNVERFSVGEGIFKNKYINKIIRVLFDRFPNFKIANLASCPTAYGMLRALKGKDFSDYAYITVSSTPYYFLFYVGYLISKKYNIPYIMAPAFHTGEGRNDPLRKKYFKRTAIPFFEYADKIILNTNAEKLSIVNFCKENGVHLDERKFLIVGQGVFVDKISNGNGDLFRKKYGLKYPIVFQMGTKNHEKGSLNLIESMKLLWNDDVKCHLVFAGQHSDDFSQYIERLEDKYKKYILNIDDISEEDKWNMFDAGDIFSMISKTDSFGIVYLEAWAYGKPVLACKNEAISEIITDGVEGYLFEFNDIKATSEKIKLLLKDKFLAKRIGMNGKQKLLEKYDWSDGIKVLDSVYEKRD